MALDYIIGGLQSMSIAVNILALGAFWILPGLRTTANRFVINLLVANVIACLAMTPAIWLNGGLKTRFYIDSDAIADSFYHSQYEEAESTLQTPSIRLTKDTKLFDMTSSNTLKNAHHQHRRDLRSQHEKYNEADTISEVPNLRESFETLVIDRDENGNIHEVSEKEIIDIQKNDENDGIEIIEEIVAEKKDDQLTEEPHSAKQREDIKTNKGHTIWSTNSLIFDCTRFWGFDLAAALGELDTYT